MNEITWGCPHCDRLIMGEEDDDIPNETGKTIKCPYCKKRAIITKIRLQFETRKPK